MYQYSYLQLAAADRYGGWPAASLQLAGKRLRDLQLLVGQPLHSYLAEPSNSYRSIGWE